MNKQELLFKIVYEYFNQYASATKTIKRIMENKVSLLDEKIKKDNWDNKLYQNIISDTIKLLNLKK